MLRSLVFMLCVLYISARRYYVWDPSDRATELVKLARWRAEQDIVETERINDANFMPRPSGCPCAFETLNIVQNKEEPTTRNIIGPAVLKIETLKHLKEITGLSVDELIHRPLWVKAWKRVFSCPNTPRPRCNPKAKYRTFDGSCNNLRNPVLGTPFQPQARFLKPEYNGDIELPRIRSSDGSRLPDVRDISNIVSPSMQRTCFDDVNTFVAIVWGTLVTMDNLETPSTSTDVKDRPITCCGRRPRAECFNINLQDDDPFLNITCMDFVRASPVLADSCRASRRQIINQLSSYLDSSQIYGLSEEDNAKIRVFSGGLLKLGENDIPPKRANIDEVVTQTAFSRLHNIYATRLSKINRHWSDEKLFQETRRIIAAIAQKITYDEYLPTFLNAETREKFCLNSKCKFYDGKENPAIRVGYSAAAGRFGHSQIAPFQRLFDMLRATNAPTSPVVLDQIVDDVVQEKVACIDGKFEDNIRDDLFKDTSGNSYDLLAINLQRGRDTGLPPYNRWREYCGLPKAYTFSTRPGGLVDHTVENARILQKIYRKTDDIDLYIGGLMEKPLPGAKVGPTFSCILASQYRSLKVGDRFFWNRETKLGFTKSQMKSIEKYTFSKVICEAYNRSSIQRNVFLIQSKRNPRKMCGDIPSINLNLWREKRRRY